MKSLTASDPLRAALRQERRLLLVICLLFGGLLMSLCVNRQQAETIERMRAEHTADHEMIAAMLNSRAKE